MVLLLKAGNSAPEECSTMQCAPFNTGQCWCGESKLGNASWSQETWNKVYHFLIKTLLDCHTAKLLKRQMFVR